MKLTSSQFADAIKAHRDRLGLTQAQTAALCQVGLRTWIEWEHEEAQPLYATMRGALDILTTAKPLTLKQKTPARD